MEKYSNSLENSKKKEQLIIENFIRKYINFENLGKEVKIITLEELKELKKSGVTLEKFLDYFCQKYGFLLHGSIHKISDDKLISQRGEIFATNKAAIAIMRSLYSNVGVCLEYPFKIDKKHPLILKIHTPSNGQFIKKDKGYIYIVRKENFINYPLGSWQFINKSKEVKFLLIVETENEDFKYPVEIYNDLDNIKNK